MKPLSTFSALLQADLKEHSFRCRKHCPAKTDEFSHVKISIYRRDRVLRSILVREMANLRRKMQEAAGEA